MVAEQGVTTSKQSSPFETRKFEIADGLWYNTPLKESGRRVVLSPTPYLAKSLRNRGKNEARLGAPRIAPRIR